MSDFHPLPGHNQVTTSVVPRGAKSHRAFILGILRDGREHTTRELMEASGCLRVGARILELRKQVEAEGLVIDTIQKGPAVFAYRLRKDGAP